MIKSGLICSIQPSMKTQAKPTARQNSFIVCLQKSKAGRKALHVWLGVLKMRFGFHSPSLTPIEHVEFSLRSRLARISRRT